MRVPKLNGLCSYEKSKYNGLYIIVSALVDGPNLQPHPVFGLHSETASVQLAARVLFYTALSADRKPK